MIESKLPKKCRRFLGVYISSVLELDILLAIWREPAKDWNPKTVGASFRIHEESALRVLEKLASRKFLDPQPGKAHTYRFSTANRKLLALLKEIQSLYETHRTSVIECIYSADEKIQILADSFVIRKDKG